MKEQSLRAIRKSIGLNQTQLADLCGVSEPLISQLERGNKKIASKETRSHIAEVVATLLIHKELHFQDVKEILAVAIERWLIV